MNKTHRVEFVTCLPAGVDWALVKEADDRFALFLMEGADLAPALEEAWIAFCQQTMGPPRPVPRPRKVWKVALVVAAIVAFGLNPWVTTATIAAGM